MFSSQPVDELVKLVKRCKELKMGELADGYIAREAGNLAMFGKTINPNLTNGFSHHYQLDESTFIFRGVRSYLYFLSHFSIKFLCVNRIAYDEMPMSIKRMSGL